MSELPEGWVEAKLGECSEIRSGVGFPHEYQGRIHGDYPFAKVGDVSPAARTTGLLGDAANWVRETDLAKLKAKVVPSGSIVFAKIGEAIRSNLRAITTRPLVVDNNVMALTPRNGLVEPRYALSFLKTQDFYPMAVSTTVPSLRKSDLEQVLLPLPPLNEQKRIVAKLDALTEKSRQAREALDEVPDLLDKLRQSILAAAFRGDLTKAWREKNPDVEPASKLLERIRTERRKRWEEAEFAKLRSKGKVPKDDSWKKKYEEPEPVDTYGLPELPEGWCWASVEELVSNYDGRRVPLKLGDRAERRGQHDYYGASGIIDRIDGYLFDGSFLLIAEDGANLLSRSSPIAFKASGKFWVNNHAHVVQTNVLREDYLMHYLNGRDISPWVSGTAQPKLNQKNMDRIPVPLAPVEESIAVLGTVESLLQSLQAQSQALAGHSAVLMQLDSSILAKAFRGELVPQDPNDQPASTLLGRIRAEPEGESAKKPRSRANRTER